MLAVDTNVVVRYILRDDAERAARAQALIDGESVWLATTVLLEAEWVLRGGYKRRRADVIEALRLFVGLPTVTLENPRAVSSAMDLCRRGADFADALHLATCVECAAFVTFDAALIKIGKAAGLELREP